jgi:hypothetical protein
MAGESEMRRRVVKILAKQHAVSVENRCSPGTPDINCTGGWIECKRHARGWPFGERTPVKLSHGLLKTQERWIEKRVRAGGRVFVLVQVGNDFVLLDGLTAIRILDGNHDKAAFRAKALLWCDGWDNLSTYLPTYIESHESRRKRRR